MKIKSLNIKNFKSIVDITINEPNPFTVFVGPNGSGKSNIFEALEFWSKLILWNEYDSNGVFGGKDKLSNRLIEKNDFEFIIELNNVYSTSGEYSDLVDTNIVITTHSPFDKEESLNDFWTKFKRLFIGNFASQKLKITTNGYLSNSADNLEKVLKRLLEDDIKKEEICDWLSLFIPEFDRIEVQKSQFSSNEDLLIYQKHYDEPFNKDLISDGTYNIIAILTAVFQSDEPQFLCIEEPENGLHPKVVKELVNLFRDACEQYGHYIWINTHSQTLVSKLEPHEVILVDKIEGETRIKQLKDFNLHGFEMDEAWLSNALGGGIPW